MPIDWPLYRFTSVLVSSSPEHEGVYALWEGDEMIYVGRASGSATVKSCLTMHYDRRDSCAENATHYSWEIAFRPAEREAQILEQFQAQHGRLPRFNAKAA
jgi:hypothetical protein